MNLIKNPILRGFNPDPSIIRVGEDYYIATSTFEWGANPSLQRPCQLGVGGPSFTPDHTAGHARQP